MENKIDSFMNDRNQEETKLTLDFAKAVLTLELEIKEIKDDIKEIKKDAKANGVSVGMVNKVINNIKKSMNEKPQDLKEMEIIEEMISNDVDIKMMISNLIKKD